MNVSSSWLSTSISLGSVLAIGWLAAVVNCNKCYDYNNVYDDNVYLLLKKKIGVQACR